MAYYDFMVEPFAKCIEAGFTKIDEVFPDDLKQKVIAFLASKGLGADGKPLALEEPEEEAEAPEEAKDEPKEPIEEAKEDEPTKDTKEEEKSPASEDKGAK